MILYDADFTDFVEFETSDSTLAFIDGKYVYATGNKFGRFFISIKDVLPTLSTLMSVSPSKIFYFFLSGTCSLSLAAYLPFSLQYRLSFFPTSFKTCASPYYGV